MTEKIKQFKQEHAGFFESLLDDTWLCESPIPEDEVKAVWRWMVRSEQETVSLNDFEKVFGITFKEITDYWNEEILQVTGRVVYNKLLLRELRNLVFKHPELRFGQIIENFFFSDPSQMFYEESEVTYNKLNYGKGDK